MSIAIITGASAGLGKEFTVQAAAKFPDIEEFWVIARREDRLRELQNALSPKAVKILPLDLCDEKSFNILAQELSQAKPQVKLLINNSGCGYLNNVGDGPLDEQVRMVDLNLRALTAVSHIVIPYIMEGGMIINVSSIASFCPNPRMTVYSAGKSYVSAFSRSIGYELRPRKITVTAVCPGPMDTEFIYLGKIKGDSKTFDTLPYCVPKKVVAGALNAAAKGRQVYTPTGFYKLYRVLSKLLPQRLMIHFATT
jgi:hypothetical protein